MSSVKKQKYLQKYKSEYFAEFPFLRKSRKSEYYVFCTDCSKDINISHGGRGDILQHVGRKVHMDNVAANSKADKINNFFKKNDDVAVIRAECLFTAFIIEHNLPLNCADHVGNLLRKMFPGNEIAKKYSCARTKSSAIIAEFAAESRNTVIENLKTRPFSLSTDGTNDSDSKIFPMVVTYFNEETEKIENSLLAMPILKDDCTGKNISELMLLKLNEYGIPIANCIAFSSDNANVMVGINSGVIAFLRQKHENMLMLGCTCHLLNLAAEKGAACLPLNVDELLVDIFYYLDKSSKRKEKLHVFQEFYDGETKKILKHVATRWLSTTKCLERLLSQWEALVAFFKSQITASKKKPGNLEFYTIPKKNKAKQISLTAVKSGQTSKRPLSADDSQTNPSKKIKGSVNKSVLSREERIFYLLTTDVNKAYCLFLLYINPVFDKYNVLLQSQTPHIHRLRALFLELFKIIVAKFVKISVIKQISDILMIDYHTIDNHLENEEIHIGEDTSNILENLVPEEKELFFTSIKNFYIKVCDYIVHKFPIKDELLINAEVCSVEKIESAKFSSIRFFLDKFPVFLREENQTSEVNELKTAFTNLQLFEIPDNIKNERIDTQWTMIGKLKNEVGEYPFKKLADVILGILSIPHSNAECERIFSKVKKNRTEFRSLLSNESLENILLSKSNIAGNCYEQNFSDDFLAKAKMATSVMVKKN